MKTMETGVSVQSSEGNSSAPRGTLVTDINAKIPAYCFLVYYFLAQDGIRCDREGKFLNGSNEAGALFPSLPEAEAFARSVAQTNFRIGSGIYDSSWKVVAEFVPEAFVKQQAARNSPSRLLLWAGALLAGGSFFLWMEVRSGWQLMFGFLIGTRLLFAGFLKLASAASALRRRLI